MIITPLLVVAVFVAADAATTTPMADTTTPMADTTTPVATKILYDTNHKKAMIVRADGCYEYHMNHNDTVAAQDDVTRAILEARMLQELSMATNIEETGHHHIDHMTQEIRTACASLPVYSFNIA